MLLYHWTQIDLGLVFYVLCLARNLVPALASLVLKKDSHSLLVEVFLGEKKQLEVSFPHQD